jgi:predicted nucleic acid-binding protein
MAYRVFADANVYLDFLLHRGSDWMDAEEIFIAAAKKDIVVFTSASVLLNIMYILNMHRVSKTEVGGYASDILKYTLLVNPDNSIFQTALSSGFSDLEDAVQYFTAINIEADYFITSNVKDYKKAFQVPVLTPKQFLKIYEQK